MCHKAGVFSLKSLKRNVIALCASLCMMHFEWFFTVAFALVLLSKAASQQEFIYVFVYRWSFVISLHSLSFDGVAW